MKKKHKSDSYTEIKRVRVNSEDLFMKLPKDFKASKSKIVKSKLKEMK